MLFYLGVFAYCIVGLISCFVSMVYCQLDPKLRKSDDRFGWILAFLLIWPVMWTIWGFCWCMENLEYLASQVANIITDLSNKFKKD